MENDPLKVINGMCDCRLNFLRSLSTWPTFGKGWERRVNTVRTTAIDMAGGVASSIDFETVKKGSTRPWVRKLQEALKIHVDGEFGPDTDAVLRAWQEEHGLEPDGIAGRVTYRALGLIP